MWQSKRPKFMGVRLQAQWAIHHTSNKHGMICKRKFQIKHGLHILDKLYFFTLFCQIHFHYYVEVVIRDFLYKFTFLWKLKLFSYGYTICISNNLLTSWLFLLEKSRNSPFVLPCLALEAFILSLFSPSSSNAFFYHLHIFLQFSKWFLTS